MPIANAILCNKCYTVMRLKVWEKHPCNAQEHGTFQLVYLPVTPEEALKDFDHGQRERTIDALLAASAKIEELSKPFRMRLFCPACMTQHVDRGEWETKPHCKHLCEKCGYIWQHADRPTVGVENT
jgi:hypothetical protein